MSIQKLVVPENFQELLPDLRTRTLRWESNVFSGTKLNTSATIKYYHPVCSSSIGSIVQIPGLGSNSAIDPLGERLCYWALTHKYDMITIDTFMGQFRPVPDTSITDKYHYSELITIIDKSIDFIHSYLSTNYAGVIGHCASANGLIDAFNLRKQQNKPLYFTSAMLFAPWPNFDDTFIRSVNKILANVKTNDELSERDKLKSDHFTFLLQMSHFISEISEKPFEPEQMAKWGIKTTFISGKRDLVSSYKLNDEKYNILTNYSDKFSHIILSGAKHDFAQITSNPDYIIQIIKNQRIKKK